MALVSPHFTFQIPPSTFDISLLSLVVVAHSDEPILAHRGSRPAYPLVSLPRRTFARERTPRFAWQHEPPPAASHFVLSSGDMAKPISANTLLAPATSYLPHSRSPRFKSKSTTAHPSSSRRRANIHRPGPSSSLLAILATVAASSSSADGRPLSSDSQPPDFLCPVLLSLDSRRNPPAAHPRRSTSNRDVEVDDVDSSIYHLSPFPTRNKRSPSRVGFVPDKYVQGEDGRWRRESSWSLYGSSYCDVRKLLPSCRVLTSDQPFIAPTLVC